MDKNIYKVLTETALIYQLQNNDIIAFDELSQRNFKFCWELINPIVKDFNVSYEIITGTFNMMWDHRVNINVNVALREQLIGMLVHNLLQYYSKVRVNKKIMIEVEYKYEKLVISKP